MYKPTKSPAFQAGTILLMALLLARPSPAGSPGAWIYTSGYGKAVARVTLNGTFWESSQTAVNAYASATASNGSYCTSQGSAPGIFYNRASLTGGATADNPAMEAAIGPVPPAPCAEYDMVSSFKLKGDKGGSVMLVATISAGAAIWLRGFECDIAPDVVTLENLLDPNVSTPVWEPILLTGPFPADPTGCNAVNIDFTAQTSNKHVYYVVDTVANSEPLAISCPATTIVFDGSTPPVYPTPAVTSGGCGGVTFSYSPELAALPCGLTTVTATATDAFGNTTTCSFNVNKKPALAISCSPVFFGCTDSTFAYPAPTITGGCRNVTVSYVPLASELPLGTTTVTATAADEAGNVATCTFTATRPSLTFDGFYSPISGTSNLGDTCSPVLRTINLGSNIPVKFKTLCNGVSVTTGPHPSLTIAECTAKDVPLGGGDFQIVANEWHFNWDTTNPTYKKNKVYILTATLQDGTKKEAIVKLK